MQDVYKRQILMFVLVSILAISVLKRARNKNVKIMMSNLSASGIESMKYYQSQVNMREPVCVMHFEWRRSRLIGLFCTQMISLW